MGKVNLASWQDLQVFMRHKFQSVEQKSHLGYRPSMKTLTSVH